MRPLDGIRVIDFSWVLAGPLGTRILANLGAEVIRVESHARLDPVRAGRPAGATSLDAGFLYNAVNSSKLSLTLDLNREQGLALVHRLVEIADVATNNFRPGVAERLGIGYEALREINKGIVSLNMPGCSKLGPWAQVGTMGSVIMAASGHNDVSGFEGRPPYGLGVAYSDFASPYLLVTTVLAALRERDRTGEGQEIDLDQLSTTISLLGVEWMRFGNSGELRRNENRSPNYCPHGVFPTRGEDEWCAIAVEGELQWSTLYELMGSLELASDARFATHEQRKVNEDELDAILSAWTREQDRWELAERLQACGIAAAAVENLPDMLRDPQLEHYRHYQHVRQPNDPEFDLVIDGEAIHIGVAERTLRRPPMMGEHNEYVLRDLLGLSQQEFDELVVDGVIN